MSAPEWSPQQIANAITEGAQEFRASAVTQDGRIAVLYIDASGSDDILRLAILNGDGSLSDAGDQRIRKLEGIDASSAGIVALTDGTLLVSYEVADATSGHDILVTRRFDADGTPLGSADDVLASPGSDMTLNHIMVLDDGGYGIFWSDSTARSGGDGNDSYAVYRLFDADGTPRGSEVHVATKDGTAASPASQFFRFKGTELEDGTIVVQADSSTSTSIYFFTPGGTLTKTMNNELSGGQTVVATETGGFLAVGEGSVRAYSAEGFRRSDLISVRLENAEWSNSLRPAATLPDGRIVMADSRQDSPGTGALDLFIFGHDGTFEIGGINIMRGITGGRALNVDVDALPDGRVVVTAAFPETAFIPADVAIGIFDPRDGSVQMNGTFGDDQYGGTANGDLIRGYYGDDVIWGHRGDDVLEGEQGADHLEGQRGNDIVRGGGGNDRLTGNRGDDRLEGGNGNDMLIGGLGTDVAEGGKGNDTIVVDSTADIAIEKKGQGNDTIETAQFSLNLNKFKNFENAALSGGRDLDLTGNGGANTLSGNGGDNDLTGRGGKDKLIGGKGDDRLDGGGGNDTLTGGGGSDTFVFGGGYGKDRVTDHRDDVDTIQLDNVLWGGGLSKAQVVNQFASLSGDNLVFDFGGGQTLTLVDYGKTTGLVNDLVIV